MWPKWFSKISAPYYVRVSEFKVILRNQYLKVVRFDKFIDKYLIVKSVFRKRLKSELEAEQRANHLLKEELNKVEEERRRREEREEEERRRRDEMEQGERRRREEREKEERQERQRMVMLTGRLEEEVNRRKELEMRLSTSLKLQREKETGIGMRIKDLGTGGS